MEYRLVAVPDVITPSGEVRQRTFYETILRDRLRNAWEETGLLMKVVIRGERSLTVEEAARLDRLTVEISQLSQRIAQL